MGYKLYFCTFRNNTFNTPEGKVFCKFGITHNSDVLARFNPDVDDGYQKSLKYLEWDIKADFSMWFDTKEEAEIRRDMSDGIPSEETADESDNLRPIIIDGSNVAMR